MQWVEESIGKITQGSIIEGVDWGFDEAPPLSIVLSNACDIENEKCSFLIVSGLVPAIETLHLSKEFCNLVEKSDANKRLSNKGWDALCKFLKDYIHNKNICRYYFFNPEPIIECDPLLADFQMIKSVPPKDIIRLQNVGKLASPFIEQLIVHFTSYSARIPSDRVISSEEQTLLLKLADEFRPPTA